MKIEKRGSNRKYKINLQNNLRDFIQHLRIRDIFGKYACQRVIALIWAKVWINTKFRYRGSLPQNRTKISLNIVSTMDVAHDVWITTEAADFSVDPDFTFEFDEEFNKKDPGLIGNTIEYLESEVISMLTAEPRDKKKLDPKAFEFFDMCQDHMVKTYMETLGAYAKNIKQIQESEKKARRMGLC